MAAFELNSSKRSRSSSSDEGFKGKSREDSNRVSFRNKKKAVILSDDAQDGWMGTYADAITLLMAFFVLMFSISDINQEKFEQVKGSLNEEMLKKEEKTPFKEIEKVLNEAIVEKELTDVVQIERDPLGITIELASTSLYASGSATILDGMKPVLSEVAKSISLLDFPNFLVEVEGHTDDIPIRSGRYDSNWELSAHRATNVVRFFIDEGIEDSKLKAAGFGESRPVKPNRDTNGNGIRENQAANRRVLINIRRAQ